MRFHVGQKVVCVNDGMIAMRGVPEIKRGQTYVIKNMRICSASGASVLNVGTPTLWLAIRFRPLIERKTDIACFTEIIDRENKNCRVPVSDHQS